MVENKGFGHMVDTWWTHGGHMVDTWWTHGGHMVDTWWTQSCMDKTNRARHAKLRFGTDDSQVQNFTGSLDRSKLQLVSTGRYDNQRVISAELELAAPEKRSKTQAAASGSVGAARSQRHLMAKDKNPTKT